MRATYLAATYRVPQRPSVPGARPVADEKFVTFRMFTRNVNEIGNMTDIEGLYKRYAHDVRRFVLFLSGDPVIADEITSDTFVSAWLARERIRQPTVKSYLFTIARNLHLDLQRRQKRHAEIDECMIDKRISAQTHMEQAAEVRTVLAALRQLPEMDRTALLMRALDGMPYEEIGQTLGISEVTAKVKVYRARLKLMQTKQAWGEVISLVGAKP
jgi:RNA polymerase sigma-70 factor, ECF subfamily